MQKTQRGDIFLDPATGSKVPFDQAFPQLDDVDVVVQETGEGNAGLGLRRFIKTSVREIINCSSTRCGGQGFMLGHLLRMMVRDHTSRARVTGRCESLEESGRPCPNHFVVDVTLRYKENDPRDPAGPFGVLAFLAWNHPWNDHHFSLDDIARAAALMRQAGIGMVRMDFLWSDLEPAQGTFDFSRYDAIVNAVMKEGVRILGLLHYNPLWREGPWYQAPEPEAYVRYVSAVVAHFRDRVRYWEVWNEPDHANYWQPQDGLLAYADLLKRAYPVIKEADATARVLTGGLSQQIPENLRQLYRLGAGDAFDIVSLHPFMTPLGDFALGHVKNICSQAHDVMEEHGQGGKPIWITEIGCPGVPAGAADVKNWWLGTNPTEAQQAQWLQDLYTSLPGHAGIQKVFWAFFRDTPNHFEGGVNYFGLVRSDFSPKPSFDTYRRLSKASTPQ